MTNRPVRRAVVIGATAALSLATPSVVTAQPTPTPPAPATVAATTARQLGERSAGSYLDRGSGRLVVTVTNSSDARTVRAAGGVPKTVTRSGADLVRVTGDLARTVKVPGTAWGIDPAANQVVVSHDDTVTGAKLAKVRAAGRRLGGAVRIEHVPGTIRPLISGGDAIVGSSFRCSLGFNVTDDRDTYLLTAGHCGNDEPTWSTSADQRIGSTEDSRFPGDDYAIVRYTGNVPAEGTVGGQDITTAGDAFVGQDVRRRGSTTGVHSGRVTGLDETVNYAEGTVTGMIRTTVCAEPGDSGGPLYDGETALGLTSGGSGDCTSGGTTFFQPVTEPLGRYGVSVL